MVPAGAGAGGGGTLFSRSLLLLLALLMFFRSSKEEKESDLLSDVCATCHANATCQQKEGKNVCICNYGFVGNGRTYCQDKDECQIGTEKICGNHTSCHNTYGSFYCVCLDGFQASSKNKIFIPNDGTNCIDIDECEVSDICGPGGQCVNTVGSYECYCMEGYQIENGSEPFHSIASKASCKVVDCGIPPPLLNAYSAPVNKTTYGHSVIYTCQPGYVIESGNRTAVCNARGQWEGGDIVCKEINCGKPPWFQNTDIIWDNTTTLGSTIYYKCKEGFQYLGEHNFSRCTLSQKWENITFECREVQAFADIKINGSCLSWRRHYGNEGINETYQLTMRMLGSGSNETTDILIDPPATDEVINVCLQLHQDANYTVKIYAKSTKWNLTLRIIQPVVDALEKRSQSNDSFLPGEVEDDPVAAVASVGGDVGESSSVEPVSEKKVVFSNISILNDTCVKWDRESGRIQSEETYIFNIQGQRWYQKQFCHKMTLNFTTNSQTPEVCLHLPPGSNYTVNISTANLDHSILVYMTTQITDENTILCALGPNKRFIISTTAFDCCHTWVTSCFLLHLVTSVLYSMQSSHLRLSWPKDHFSVRLDTYLPPSV